MNLIHLEVAIRTMEQVRDERRGFDMSAWEKQDWKSVEECGTVCCFGGWLARTSEWAEAGGWTSLFGAPMLPPPSDTAYLGDLHGHEAVSQFLGVSEEEGRQLTVCEVQRPESIARYSVFYGKPIADITPQDVIDKLNEIKARYLA